MSDPTHVYGQCQFKGDFQEVEQILEEWGFIGLLIPLEPGVFVLDGPYHSCGEGPREPVHEEDFQDCLNEVARAVFSLIPAFDAAFHNTPSFFIDLFILLTCSSPTIQIPPFTESLDSLLLPAHPVLLVVVRGTSN